MLQFWLKQFLLKIEFDVKKNWRFYFFVHIVSEDIICGCPNPEDPGGLFVWLLVRLPGLFSVTNSVDSL